MPFLLESPRSGKAKDSTLEQDLRLLTSRLMSADFRAFVGKEVVEIVNYLRQCLDSYDSVEESGERIRISDNIRIALWMRKVDSEEATRIHNSSVDTGVQSPIDIRHSIGAYVLSLWDLTPSEDHATVADTVKTMLEAIGAPEEYVAELIADCAAICRYASQCLVDNTSLKGGIPCRKVAERVICRQAKYFRAL